MSASRGQRVALVGLGIIVGLGILEGGLRLWARTETPLALKLREWDPEGSSLELVGASCYRPRPESVLLFPNGATSHINRLGYRGPVVAEAKPVETFRVVLLGGSTSHGFAVDDDETIDAHLRRELAAATGGRRIEVVNLGLDGLDTICELERLRRDGLPLGPDAVVVHTGINDVLALRFDELAPNDPARGFRAERRLAEERRMHERGLWRLLKHDLFVARLPGIVRQLAAVRPAALSGPAEPSTAALDAFESTVRAMVALVPDSTTVLFSTPPSALLGPAAKPMRYVPPIVDVPTTQHYRDQLDARLRRIAADLTERGWRAAYVPHALPGSAFFDDCHLTGEGNRLLAADFARVLAPRVLSAPAAAGMTDAP